MGVSDSAPKSVYVYIYICKCIYMSYIYTNINIYIYMCVCVCAMHVCLYVHVCVHICTCMDNICVHVPQMLKTPDSPPRKAPRHPVGLSWNGSPGQSSQESEGFPMGPCYGPSFNSVGLAHWPLLISHLVYACIHIYIYICLFIHLMCLLVQVKGPY